MRIPIISRLGVWLFAVALSSPAPAASDTRQHDAHQHGAAELRVVLEGKELEIEFESPALNIVGFEHMPRDQKQTLAVQQALATLRDANRVFVLPAAAQCTVREVKVEGALAEGGHHADRKKGHSDEHSELHVHYRYTCAQTDALYEIEVKLFALFPRTEKLKLELIGPKGQKAGELTRNKARIVF